MKHKKTILMTVISAVSILQFSSIKQINAKAETSDYVDGAFQTWKYQDDCSNLFLGNSIFQINNRTIGLYQSLCLKAPANKSITMAFYINETFNEENFKSARIKAQFTDVNNPDNKMIIDESFTDLYDFAFRQMRDCDFYAFGNVIMLEFYTSDFSDKFIVHGSDKENYFQMDFDFGKDYVAELFYLGEVSDVDQIEADFESIYSPIEIGEYKDTILKYDNSTYSFTTNVTNPIPLNKLLEGFKAFDFSDNEEVSIDYEDVNYLDAIKNKELGKYYINLIASDSNNNISKLQVEVELKDYYAPEIIFPDDQNVIRIPISQCNEIGSTIDLNDFITIVDDYDKNPKITDETKNVTFDSLGSKNFTIKITDFSGNFITKKLNVEFYDDIKPTIEMADYNLNIYPFEYKSAQDIVSKLVTFNDNIKVTQTGIKDDNYTANYKKEGQYSFIVYAYDEEGNYTEQKVNVNVEDNQGPVFIINEYSLSFYTTDEYFSAQNMLNLLIDRNQMAYKKYKVVEYANEVYNENFQKAGEYDVLIACYDEDYNKELILVKLTITDAKTNINFFTQVKNFFTDIFENIKEFFEKAYNTVVSWFKR